MNERLIDWMVKFMLVSAYFLSMTFFHRFIQHTNTKSDVYNLNMKFNSYQNNQTCIYSHGRRWKLLRTNRLTYENLLANCTRQRLVWKQSNQVETVLLRKVKKNQESHPLHEGRNRRTLLCIRQNLPKPPQITSSTSQFTQTKLTALVQEYQTRLKVPVKM